MCPEIFNTRAIAESLLYMYGGAPACLSRAVRYILISNNHYQWETRGGSTAWLRRSPNLNPLDFYLWGHLKSVMYAVLVDTKIHFIAR
jgi:hypothetical protein